MSARDLLTLIKPNITATSMMMCAGGVALAPAAPGLGVVAATLAGTGLAVGSANALNMWMERESDGRMTRTRRRPLPDGRLRASVALAWGLGLGLAGLVLLAGAVSWLACALTAIALVGYVVVYTPLKRRTPLALPIGAIPGAMPPLIGWAAATGRVDAPGLVLFGVLFLWQVPHFVAIAVRYQADYARAGIRTVVAVRGDRVARAHALAYATALVPVGVLLVPLGVAGAVYGAVALAAGVWMVVRTASRRHGWSTALYRASLVYLPVVILALAIDRSLP